MNSFGSVRGQLHFGAPRRRAGNVTGSEPQSKAAPVPGSYFTLAQDRWVPLDPERWEHCCLSAQYTCQRPATIYWLGGRYPDTGPAGTIADRFFLLFFSFDSYLALVAMHVVWLYRSWRLHCLRHAYNLIKCIGPLWYQHLHIQHRGLCCGQLGPDRKQTRRAEAQATVLQTASR